MTELLKRSWIAPLVVQSLKNSLDNNVPPKNLFEGKDGGFGLSIKMRKKTVQLIEVCPTDPVSAPH
jgi:hypothetical protein